MTKTFTKEKIILNNKKGFCVSLFINNVFFAKTFEHTQKEAIEKFLELEFYIRKGNQFLGWSRLHD